MFKMGTRVVHSNTGEIATVRGWRKGMLGENLILLTWDNPEILYRYVESDYLKELP